MKEYFRDWKYKYIYLGGFFYNFANALSEVFGTVMLYKSGVWLWTILLIYAFRFGITSILTPLFIPISSKLGIAKCIFISNLFSIICSYMMLMNLDINKYIVIFIIAMGFMGLSNPSSDALSSRYVDDKYRGRFNSFLNITKVVAVALASLLVAWGVISKNSIILFIIIVLCFLLHYVFIKKIDYKPINNSNVFKATINYIIKSKSKYKLIYSLRGNHMIEKLFTPLFLYLILKDFKSFSIVIIISLLFQIITISFIGKYADKNISRANNLVTVIKVFITGLYLFLSNKLLISINKTLSDNFEKVYETSIQTSIQNIIKNSSDDNELLSVVGQVMLCFTEFIILLLLSIISFFINIKIFYVIFIISIFSTIFIDINIIKNDL